MRIQHFAIGFFMVSVLGQAIYAAPVSIKFRPDNGTTLSNVGFGRGASLPPMDIENGIFHKDVDIDSIRMQRYMLQLQFGQESIPLPIRLNRYADPIDFSIRFSPPSNCNDYLVVRAETPAQNGSIQQALERYLLAAHLLNIADEKRRCRGSQPSRLQKALIDRGIQLGTFEGSPFLPPEGDFSQWVRILGQSTAEMYRMHVDANGVALLDAERIDAQSKSDFAAAADINSALLDDIRSDPSRSKIYGLVGLTEQALQKNQAYLEARLRPTQT